MLGGGIHNDVIKLIEEWVPDDHEQETDFSNDLQDYLDEQLNQSGNMGHPGLGDTGGTYAVRREYGKSRADVAVGDEVGIELKREFETKDLHTLRGQIEKYREEFPCVVVVACGLSDIGGWRELQSEYEGPDTIDMQMNRGQVHFVRKHEENFGKDQSDVQGDDGGILGGGGLF